MLKLHKAEGPVCHVGSLINNKETSEETVLKLRSNFKVFSEEYVGIDLFDGPNVDLTGDLTEEDFLEKRSDLKNKFGIIICNALLEHVENPFRTGQNIEGMLRTGGHLFFNGPWVWGYHPYPNDFWRISYEGLKVIFKNIEFIDWWYSGTKKNLGYKIDKPEKERSNFRVSVDTSLSDRAMPYLNIGAIGFKKDINNS